MAQTWTATSLLGTCEFSGPNWQKKRLMSHSINKESWQSIHDVVYNSFDLETNYVCDFTCQDNVVTTNI